MLMDFDRKEFRGFDVRREAMIERRKSYDEIN